MKELIKRYTQEAEALERYSLKLKQMISSERDVDKLNDLRKRKRVVDSEWFEVLDDIRRMQG